MCEMLIHVVFPTETSLFEVPAMLFMLPKIRVYHVFKRIFKDIGELQN